MADKWDLDASGNIVLNPVMGFQVGTGAETAVLARIQFARSEDQLRKGGEALQFALSPKIAIELAEDLRKTAEKILNLPRPTKTN
jgi:hypothetical protein